MKKKLLVVAVVVVAAMTSWAAQVLRTDEAFGGNTKFISPSKYQVTLTPLDDAVLMMDFVNKPSVNFTNYSNPIYFTRTGILATLSYSNSSVIWIDPINGNDNTGLRGFRERPFKTLYNCNNKTTHSFYGAITAAQAGDTLVCLPGVHITPSCPLNSDPSLGLNLFVPAGAAIVRTNKFYAQDGTIQTIMFGQLSSSGPMIIPGNNSTIIVDGAIYATNSNDAAVGWFDSINTWSPIFYGITNRMATNVFIGGSGLICGNIDTLYFAQTNLSQSSLIVNNLILLGTYDYLKVSGNMILTTKNLWGWATNAPSAGYAQGLNLDTTVQWSDYYSVFGCSGGTTANQPLSLTQITNVFYGTRLYSTSPIILSGASANPYFLTTNSTTSGCVTFQDSSGATVYNSCLPFAFVSPRPVTLTESSATLVFNVPLASGKFCGLRLMATTDADDGTDFQAVAETIAIAAVNKAGTVSTTVSAAAPQAVKATTGTLTTTWTAVANGNSFDVKCNAVSSLTQTTLKTRWRVEFDSDSTTSVTPQ